MAGSNPPFGEIIITEQKVCRVISFIFLVLLLSTGSITISCTPTKNKPHIINGILDLRNWDFKKDGSIDTEGYWQFHFNDFLSGNEFETKKIETYSWVPGVWKRGFLTKKPNDNVTLKKSAHNKIWNGIKLSSTGYASYNIKVLFPPHQKSIGIKVRDVGTAGMFFVNDSLYVKSGLVGTSRETSKPQYLPKTLLINNLTDTTFLTFWISNYDYRKGGLWKTLTLGDSEQLFEKEKIARMTQIFNEGVWFMVIFMLFVFFIYRPKEKAILHLLLWAIASAIRLLSADDRLITVLIPNINFDLLIKMELISGFAMVPFSISAFNILFPNEYSRSIKNFMLYSFFCFLIIAIVTDPSVYTHLVVPYQILNILGLMYSSLMMLHAIHNKREGAIIMGTAIIVVLFVYIVQILFYNQLSNTDLGSNSMFTGFILAFAQVIILARTFSSALSRVENFAGELESTVELRTNELIKAQEQIILIARQSETEKVRRRISQDIHDDISSGLNKISWMSELVKIKAQKNKPEELNNTLDKIIKSSRDTVDNLIEIIWSLNPNFDDLESLLSYMRNYINRYFDESPFNVTIKFPDHIGRIELNPELKRNIFLVMKEALHNAAKYSDARNIIAEFNFTNNNYIFIIKDDGVGIAENEVKGTGNGMINMQKRMSDISGKFTLETEPGKGTSIILEGPVY